LPDLSPAKSLVVDGQVRELFSLPDGRLGVDLATCEKADLYDEETLTRADESSPNTARYATMIHQFHFHRFSRFPGPTPSFERLGGAYRLGNVVFDEHTGRPEMILDALIPLSQATVGPEVIPYPLFRWNRLVAWDGLLTAQDERLAHISAEHIAALEDYPAMACVRIIKDRQRAGDSPRATLRLELRDLIKGEMLEEYDLGEILNPPREDDIRTYEAAPRVALGGETLVVAVGQQVNTVRLSRERLQEYPRPLQFVPQLDPLAVPVGRPAQLAKPMP
jgi:hypothetical protein